MGIGFKTARVSNAAAGKRAARLEAGNGKSILFSTPGVFAGGAVFRAPGGEFQANSATTAALAPSVWEIVLTAFCPASTAW